MLIASSVVELPWLFPSFNAILLFAVHSSLTSYFFLKFVYRCLGISNHRNIKRTVDYFSLLKGQERVKINLLTLTFKLFIQNSPNCTYVLEPALPPSISDQNLEYVVDLLGPSDLQHLFNALDIPHRDVEKAEMKANTNDVNIQAMYVMRHWRSIRGVRATKEAILEALQRCNNIQNKEELEIYWNMRVGYNYCY